MTDMEPAIGFVSTYPPTECGLATFTFALREAIAGFRGTDEGLDVVSLVDRPNPATRPEVVYQHRTGDRASLTRAAEILNARDIVLLQHEYGIFGGQDGVEVLDLLSTLDVPVISTLHTVLSKPGYRHRMILERVVDLSDHVIVMSDTARQRLAFRYDVDPDKILHIPHGARTSLAGPSLARGSRPVVLTWGLIGPGKGLETAIEAFTELNTLDPLPRYRLVGGTHPKVRAAQGDAYLDGLKSEAARLGLESVVEFDSRYLDVDELARTVRAADIVLLPYESTDQVTSGVLVEAIAAGKPVVATAFPHAVEMLSGGAGLTVPHHDSHAMAIALQRILTDPDTAIRMAGVARAEGAGLLWPAIAARYEAAMAATMFSHRLLGGIRQHQLTARTQLARVG